MHLQHYKCKYRQTTYFTFHHHHRRHYQSIHYNKPSKPTIFYCENHSQSRPDVLSKIHIIAISGLNFAQLMELVKL